MRNWFIVPVAVFLMAHSLSADPLERETKTIEADGASRLVVHAEFGAGSFFIRPKSMDAAAILVVEYSPDFVRHSVEYKKRGDTGYLDIESDHRGGNWDWNDDNDLENEWRLTLSDKYPMELEIEIGACESEFDFGGIPITDFSLEIGAASGLIEFSAPNPERIVNRDIDIGAASLEIRDLGNANFERLSLSCGAAAVELSFDGNFKGESTIDLDVGIGAVELSLPRNVAVRIETDDNGWFSSVDFDDLDVHRVRRGIYETDGFKDATDRIIIRLDIGMGSVDLLAGR